MLQHTAHRKWHQGTTEETYNRVRLIFICPMRPTWLVGVHSWCPLPHEGDWRPLSLPWPGPGSWTWLMLWREKTLNDGGNAPKRTRVDFYRYNWHLLLLAMKTSTAVFWRRYRLEKTARISLNIHFPCRPSVYAKTWKDRENRDECRVIKAVWKPSILSGDMWCIYSRPLSSLSDLLYNIYSTTPLVFAVQLKSGKFLDYDEVFCCFPNWPQKVKVHLCEILQNTDQWLIWFYCHKVQLAVVSLFNCLFGIQNNSGNIL